MRNKILILTILGVLSPFTISRAWDFQECVEVNFDHPDCVNITPTPSPQGGGQSVPTLTPPPTGGCSNCDSYDPNARWSPLPTPIPTYVPNHITPSVSPSPKVYCGSWIQDGKKYIGNCSVMSWTTPTPLAPVILEASQVPTGTNSLALSALLALAISSVYLIKKLTKKPCQK